MQNEMSWTEEKVNKLKELWGKGNTASQIAEIIGGISRNAVIGKAHRLNLSAKIKTRAATSNKIFENSQVDKSVKSKTIFRRDVQQAIYKSFHLVPLIVLDFLVQNLFLLSMI